LNTQLSAAGSLVTATDDATDIDFTSAALGASSEATITNLAENTVATGFADATDSGTDGNYKLTFNVGGVDTTIDLRNAPDVGGSSYDDAAGGGAVIASYINSVSGLDASFSASTNQFTIAASDGNSNLTLVNGSSSALEYLGLSAGSFENTEAITGTETVAAVNLQSLSEGDLKINGVTISSSSASTDTASSSLANSSDKAASGISIAAAINASSSETGVSANVNATVVDGGDSSTGTTARAAEGDQGVVYINGFATNTLSLGTDTEANRADAIGAINKISGQTGVTASDAGGYMRLTAADGRNISVAIDSKGTSFSGDNIGLRSSKDGIGEANFSDGASSYATVAETTASTVTLTSAKEFTIAAGTNGTAGLQGLGLVAGTYGGSEDGQFLADIDISTVEGAEAAILALDNAIATVSAQRADLGAIQNRLESTVGNLTVTAENLTAANSRILDADFAVETAELSRSQVLQQAGISILSQANASSQQVLSLLQ
jgi:flagellin